MAIVKVTVNRNQVAPQFGQTNGVTIPYTQPIGIPFSVLNATDGDTQVTQSNYRCAIGEQLDIIRHLIIRDLHYLTTHYRACKLHKT